MFVRSIDSMNARVFLLLGTNIGDRKKNLADALANIERDVGRIRNKSSLYETAAWGKTDQAPFYNQAIEVETFLLPQQLLDAVLTIEQKLGRRRTDTWGERIIDLDILFYNEEIIETENLVVPHPQIAYRRFTLVPLNEMIPEFIHPKFQMKISELLESCADKLAVIKV